MAWRLIYKLFRFGLMGAVCSLLYAILAHALIKVGELNQSYRVPLHIV